MSVTFIPQLMTDLEAGLQAAAPPRTVTRTLKDFADRDAAELKAGVFTLLWLGLPAPTDDAYDDIRVLLVGQGQVDENADGPTLEAYELEMIADVHRLVRNAGGTPIALQAVTGSGQIDHPYCSIRAELLIGPIPLAEEPGELSQAPRITY